ncbi:hypothetical protein K9M48_00520 [Candidatus Gracilibacteria bacterium]|nr:hypothetical protein [Candidatus Gracilibacteria bacterium]
MYKQAKIKNQSEGIKNGHIFPIKGVFKRTQSKEILTSQLYQNLQRSLSPNEYFFKGNNGLFQKNNPQHNKEIYNLFQSYIVIDPDKLPANFTKLFELDINSEDIQSQVESIFKKARLLDKNSARIIFVEDKIVIFRNEERLVHKGSKLTKGEKKRSEITTTFNTFSNIYDAVRSQYHTIQSSQEKQDDYKFLQQDILKLAQEIQTLGYGVKDGEFKRKLNGIIGDIENATNFKILGAKLQNLQELTFTNRSIDSKLLEGAKNKFSKRFKDLQSIIGIVTNQLLDLENILTEYQNSLELFLAQIQFTDKGLSWENYNNGYLRLEQKYGIISPFDIFYKWIEKYKDNKELFPKVLHYIQTFFEVYKDEHQKKLSGIDVNPKEFKDFEEIKDNLKNLENIIIKT